LVVQPEVGPHLRRCRAALTYSRELATAYGMGAVEPACRRLDGLARHRCPNG
jgi:hypothetical protein